MLEDAQVAVIGVGCTNFGDLFELGYEDLICEAAFQAYADARIDPQEIQDELFNNKYNLYSVLGVDKFLTISWESGRRWVLADARRHRRAAAAR